MTGDRLLHAYILAAPPEAGYAAARAMAQTMLCSAEAGRQRPCGVCRDCRKVLHGTHPDVIVVGRRTDEKGKPRREIYVDQVREIAAGAAIAPSEAERKVYIIRDAGTMNPAAQNAFLKLLEEPPSFDAFLLVADSADQLLETVRSRCVLRTENEGPEAEAPDAESRELAERYLELAAAGARVSLISFANAAEALSGAELTAFVRSVRALASDMLCGRLPARGLSRPELLRLCALMDRAEEYLRFNVSVKHVLGLLSVETVQ